MFKFLIIFNISSDFWNYFEISQDFLRLFEMSLHFLFCFKKDLVCCDFMKPLKVFLDLLLFFFKIHIFDFLNILEISEDVFTFYLNFLTVVKISWYVLWFLAMCLDFFWFHMISTCFEMFWDFLRLLFFRFLKISLDFFFF